MRTNNNNGATCLAMTTCLAGTGVAGWTWAKFIWPAMADGGVDFTGRVLITVFTAGEYSALVGAAATGALLLTGLSAYCCYRACKSEPSGSQPVGMFGNTRKYGSASPAMSTPIMGGANQSDTAITMGS